MIINISIVVYNLQTTYENCPSDNRKYWVKFLQIIEYGLLEILSIDLMWFKKFYLY